MEQLPLIKFLNASIVQNYQYMERMIEAIEAKEPEKVRTIATEFYEENEKTRKIIAAYVMITRKRMKDYANDPGSLERLASIEVHVMQFGRNLATTNARIDAFVNPNS